MLGFGYFGVGENGAKLAMSDFHGPQPSHSTPREYGADMHGFGADRDGAEWRGQTPK
jgi:hypothetical protein